MQQTIEITIDNTELDAAIEKAGQLVELLQKAEQIIVSLSGNTERKNE